ncbi:MAG: hypothetical protein ACW99G_15260 [Candidatus Thorarchaeota archaeon]|jgi:hypothetical protein
MAERKVSAVTIVDEIQFYKAVLEDDSKFTSIIVNKSKYSVEYKAGEVCHAQHGKVFLFANFGMTATFARYYSREYDMPIWLFKAEVDRPSLKRGLVVPSLWEDGIAPEDMDDWIPQYWDFDNENPSLYTAPPRYPLDETSESTWVSNWAILKRGIKIFDNLCDYSPGSPEIDGRAINRHDLERVNLERKWVKIYV